MSWYSSSWTRRYPISVYNSTGTATQDVSHPCPATRDELWSNIQANGEDIRVTEANGVTLVTYDLNTVSASSKSGTIELDNVTTAINGGTTLFWVYYGNSGAADAKTVFAPAAALTGYTGEDAPRSRIVPVRMQRPGATVPTAEISKTAAEEFDVYFEFTDVLVRRQNLSSGTDRQEEIASVTLVATSGGAPALAVIDASKVRFVEWGDRMFVAARVRAGSDGTDYTVVLTATTTGVPNARIIQGRCLLKVRDVDDA